MSTQWQQIFIPNSGFWDNWNLRKCWLPRLWTGVECAWANSQGLVSHYLFPLKLYPFPPDSSQLGTSLLRCQEAALSRRRLKLWTPAPGELKARWHFQGSFVNLLLCGFELWKLLVRYQRTGRWSHDTLLPPSWCPWHQLPFIEACCGSRFLSVALTLGFQFWLPLHFPWPYCPVTVANSCLCSFLDCFTVLCWPLRDFLWVVLDSLCFVYSELFLCSCLGSH